MGSARSAVEERPGPPRKRPERVPRELQSTKLSCGDDEGTNIILISALMEWIAWLDFTPPKTALREVTLEGFKFNEVA